MSLCIWSCRCNLTLQDILPDDPRQYDKTSPPKKNGLPTVVLFHVTVMSLDSIDEESMTYAADIFFSQSWKDHQLRLPDNMTAEYRVLETDWLEQVWRPDCFFKNAKQVTFQTMTVPNHFIWLYSDKTILYMVKLTLTLSCAMNFASYSHDTQTCSLQMESLSHTTDDLVFEWNDRDPPVVHTDFHLPQLDLEYTDPQDCTKSYSTAHVQAEATTGLLHVPHLHPHLPDCRHVLGLVLDKAGSCAGQGDVGRHQPSHPVHATRQEPGRPASRVAHQGHRHLHVLLHCVRVRLAHGVRRRQRHPRRRLQALRRSAKTWGSG
ncbi:glycine receptor subunit alpha-3 isoform X1 [Rhipicephalus microplus]|uniref:glycine receptor subunit alpha-3 isoform X1 n=1 Tax=Rhipicephalus microplus TaxID=6941 RepID=UPI003F6AAAF0